MAVFHAVKNINPVQTHPLTTTFTISKGVPVRLAAGVVTVCATNVMDCLGVAHETVASGNSGYIKVLPAQGPNGTTLFKSANTTIASTSTGITYLLVMATNAATVGAANTTVGPFYAVTADGTDVYGYLTGNAFQGNLSLTA